MLEQTDNDLIVFLAGGAGCSLDSSPKKNWVERSGGLPNYICKIAKAVMRSGKSKSSAIAIAVSRVKKWAAGGDDVDADTRAKAAKAVAEWTALKAKNKSRKLVKASESDGGYVYFSNVGSFSTDLVRRAWDDLQRQHRLNLRKAKHAEQGEDYSNEIAADEVPYTYIREMWTDHLIVEVESYGSAPEFARIPYSVAGNLVVFGEPVRIEQQWVEVEEEDSLNEMEAVLLQDVLVLSPAQSSYLKTVSDLMSKG